MKFATVALVVAGLAAAQPHKHHHHAHKRTDPNVVTVYELDGKLIPADEVQQGINNGTLVFDMGTGQVSSAPAPAPAAPATQAPPVQAPAAPSPPAINVAESMPAPKVKAKVAPAPKAAPSLKLAQPASSSDSSNDSTGSFSVDQGTGMDSEFPDGEISCSTFPSKFGAIPISWMNYGGWSGIQAPEHSSAGFANIVTKVTDMCPGGQDCCAEGDYCSYACPPGYQKAQWPTTQGATGQSVGGLLCQGGKLHKTNPAQKSLCMKGAQQVKVQVKNNMGKVASVCRTDYPGTENEVVPLSSTPGSIKPLTCPDADNYYKWQGGSTSAQYYVNPAGVPVEDACQWGDSSKPWGNFAPLNLGVGYSAGAAWLSIFQNLPTTNQKLDFTVELVGDNGGYDNFVGKCKYQNGQYCSGDNYENCSSDGKGCTVNVQSGTATFVFS